MANPSSTHPLSPPAVTNRRARVVQRQTRRREINEIIRSIKYNKADLHTIFARMEQAKTPLLSEDRDFMRQFVNVEWLTDAEAASILYRTVEKTVLSHFDSDWYVSN